MMVEVTGLHIYPVKSFKGVKLDTAELTATGLSGDRQWMVIDSNNRFVSQRQIAAMATLSASCDDTKLTLSNGSSEIKIARIFGGSREVINAQIWQDSVSVWDEGSAASEWLGEQIGVSSGKSLSKKLRLVRMTDASQRPQSKPHLLGELTHTQFADMAPLLVANSASLAALNTALQQRGLASVGMDRFRPNIVVSGLPAFAEHNIQNFSHNNYALTVCYPCQRCVITTIDQDTGIKHPNLEPFLTLRDINSMPAFGPQNQRTAANAKAPAFGENVTLASQSGASINIGDLLRVVHK